MEKNTLTRRQMVQRMALAIGGTLVAPTVLLESCSFDPDTSTAGPERLAILDAIAETIIPRTATAGARDARIGAFIDVMIRDCYYPRKWCKTVILASFQAQMILPIHARAPKGTTKE